MITINLLDQSSARGKASSAKTASFKPARPQGSAIGTILILLSAVVMLALNGGAGWFVFTKINTAESAYKKTKKEHEAINAEIKENLNTADEIRKYREVVSNQMDVLKSLDPPDRLLWCEKFNMLANLIPPDVFLDKIEIKENIRMVETEQSKAARAKWATASKKKDAKKTPEPKPVKRPEITYKMDITGLALGRDNVEQFDNALNFHKAMIAYNVTDHRGVERRFMDGFNDNIEFKSVEATVYEGAPVNRFIFTLTTRPMGEESTPADKAVPASSNTSK